MAIEINDTPTQIQLMLGDMLHHFCTAVIDNVMVDKTVIRLMSDNDDICVCELYCLIDIQSVIYEVKGHYDIGLFVNTGLSKSSLGILDKVTLELIKHTMNETSADKINLIAIENLIKNNLLSKIYLDADKLSPTLDILKAGVLIAFPEINNQLKNGEWETARNLILTHTKSELENI